MYGDAADALGGFAGNLNKAGVDTEAIFAPMRRAREQQDRVEQSKPGLLEVDRAKSDRYNRGIQSKWAAAASGLIGADDAINNLPRWAINQVYKPLGIPEIDYTHYRQDFDNLPGVRDLKQEAPDFYNQYAETTQAVAPTPNRAGDFLGAASKLNAKAFLRIADAALTQGGLGAANATNAKVQNKENPQFQDALGGFAGGALLGGAVHGVAEGIGKGIELAGKGVVEFNKRRLQQILSRPQDPETISRLAQTIDRQIEGGQIDVSDPEVRAALGALRQHLSAPEARTPDVTAPQGSAENPLQGGVSTSQAPDQFEMAIADIASASDKKTRDAAVRKARALMPEAYDKMEKYELNERIERAKDEQDVWQNWERQPQQEYGPDAPQGPKLTYPGYLDFNQTPKAPGYPDYLDLEMSASHPRQSEQLKFPEYLDFSQEPQPTFTNVTRPGMADLDVSLRRVANNSGDVAGSPREPRQYPDIDWGRPLPEPQPVSMGDLADVLAGPSTAGSVNVGPMDRALARIRTAPNEAALQAGIAEANQLIPKNIPKDYKKILKNKINDAFRQYKGEPLQGGVQHVEQKNVFDEIKQEEWQQPAPRTESAAPQASMKKALSDKEEFDLKQKESQMFPNHNDSILVYNRGKGSGESIRLQPRSMTDSQLDDAFDYADATTKMQSSKPHEKTRAKQELKAIVDEKMRREFRRSQNLPEDWTGGTEDMRLYSEDKLGSIISESAEDDPRAIQAGLELVSRSTPAPVAPAHTPVQGNSRQLIPRNEDGTRQVGYQQAHGGKPLSTLKAEDIPDVEEHMILAAEAKEIAYQLEQLNKDVYKMLATSADQVKYGDHYYKRDVYDTVLNGIGEALKNKLVDKLAIGVEEEIPYTMRAVVDSPENWVEKLDPRMPVEQLNQTVNELKEQLKTIEETLKKKRPLVAKMLGDEPVSDFVNVGGKQVRVSVRKVNKQMQRTLDEKGKKIIKEWEQRMLKLTKYTKQKEKGLTPGRKSPESTFLPKVLLNVGGASLTATSAAHADDGTPESDETRRINAIMRATGWALLAGANLHLVGKALKTKPLLKVANLYADTLDHAERIDNLLGLQGKDRLFRIINEHNAAAAQASWGVRFDSQNNKAEALQMLNARKITPQGIFDPVISKGTPFESMTKDQRSAIVGYWLSRKTLGNKLRAYANRLDMKLKDPRLTPAVREQIEREFGDSITAVQNLNTEFNSAAPKATHLEKTLLGGATSNMMDAYFMWNPQFHALNLLDSVIMGMFGFGAKRMAQAQIDMLADKELRAVMAESNLFGNYRAERTAYAGKVQQNKGAGQLEDLGSDTFNANRVALMAWSEYYDLNKASMQKLGVANYRDLAKKLVRGQLDPTVSMDAWVHMMERSSRFLGVDPLKANRNFIQQQKALAPLLSFVAQPARAARLINYYAANGDHVALARFFVIVTALGGSAAIPKWLQFAGERLDPDGMQVVETALDSVSIPGFTSNNIPALAPFVPELSEKLDYDNVLPAQFAATGVGPQAAYKTAQDAWKLEEAMQKGDVDKMQAQGYKVAKGAAQVAMPRLPFTGLPTGETIRAGEDIGSAIAGFKTYHNFTTEGKRIGGGEIELDELPGGRALPIVDHVAPGIPSVIYRAKKAESAAYFSKQHGEEPLKINDLNLLGARFPLTWSDPLEGKVTRK